MTVNMNDILEKCPEFENKLYIIGGSRREALREAMAILLRLTDRCPVTTEWFCLKDSEETIKSTFDEVAAALASARVFVTISELSATAMSESSVTESWRHITAASSG